MFRTTGVMRAVLGVFVLLTVGCSQNYYNIPRESYEKKVRIIGVAPILIDAESDIRHPDKGVLVSLVKDYNRKNDAELVSRLRATGSYYAVQSIEDDADRLYNSLFSRRERRDDAGIVYNKYFFKTPEIKDILAKNRIDAIFLVVVSGLTTKGKILSSNLLSSLEADYNYLIMTGQIIDGEGNILWEYPNFRQLRLSFPPLLPLQYPDFDEAKANATERVEVKFKIIPGLNRAFLKTDDSSVRKGGKVSELYNTIIDDMMSMLKPEFDWFGLAKKEKPAPPPPAYETPAARQQPAASTPVPQKTTPAAAPAPVTPAEPPTSAPVEPSAPTSPGSPSGERITSPTIAPAS